MERGENVFGGRLNEARRDVTGHRIIGETLSRAASVIRRSRARTGKLANL